MFRSVRNLVRLVAIGRTLGRHDALFADEVSDVSPGLGWILRRLSRRGVPGRQGERLAAALTELGPSFIKLGQMLATRSDLVGEQVAADLATLQDRLPPFSEAEARATIEAELERPLDELFARFDGRPVAAASIAQVHFAETADGVPVAVKVLRPDIERRFRRDLDLMTWIAELVEVWWPGARRLRPAAAVDLFARSVRIEMDLRMEASAAAEFAGQFVGDDRFRVPRVDWERTGRRVMTLERLSGVRFDDAPAIAARGFELDPLLLAASESLFRQVFVHGFFHADLHPGNMFVLDDGRIGYVDFGIMGRLDEATRRFLADMLLGFLERDYRRVAQVHFDAGYVPADQDFELFVQAVRSIGEPVHDKPLHEISVGRLLAQLFEITDRFRMETQPQLLLLQKTMLTAEGTGRRLNPNVNIWELARPLIEEWMRENRGPEARAAETVASGLEILRRLPTLARDVERAAALIADGGLKLHPTSVERIADVLQRRRAALVWTIWGASVAAAAVLALLLR